LDLVLRLFAIFASGVCCFYQSVLSGENHHYAHDPESSFVTR
jgi:hypothetical protein